VTPNGLLVSSAGLCFTSFVWGMGWHFRRLGKPSPTMLATAVLGFTFATLQLTALDRRPLPFPTAALLLYALSAGLFWWAVRVTRRKLAACGQRCVSSEVVAEGPYRYIRHPFYAAYDLTWLAGFVATGWWPLGLATLAMGALYECLAREEELAFLATSLATQYESYRQRTGKYLPRPVFR
jgi:protein-S-isoprenylcysteine O-methyltransferase Ste14